MFNDDYLRHRAQLIEMYKKTLFELAKDLKQALADLKLSYIRRGLPAIDPPDEE